MKQVMKYTLFTAAMSAPTWSAGFAPDFPWDALTWGIVCGLLFLRWDDSRAREVEGSK